MTREWKVLERHFRHWREKGLVPAELEVQLRSASDELAKGSAGRVMRTALGGLGGALLLAGLTLVIAENWEVLDRGVKLAGWGILQVGFLFAAYHLGRLFPDRPALAEALTLVAGGWVLAGIALVSQIYHLDARPPNGVWLWLVLVLPAAWLLERRAVSAVVFVALVAGFTLETAQNDSWVHAREASSPWLWLAIPLLAAALASWLPRAASFIGDWVGAWSFVAANFVLLVFGTVQELDRSGLGRAWGLAAPGLLLAVALPERVLPRAWDALTARLVLAATLLPWIVMGSRYERGALLGELAVGLSWIAQLAIAVLVIRAGARGESESWINLGYLALLAGILTRYFDFFGEYLQGGLALALTGGLLLFILYALERARRRTLRVEVAV